MVKNENKKGMLSIGTRPTLDDTMERIEINIFDFDDNIYGQKLKVTVKKYLRNQIKFNSLQDLKDQMLLDKQDALQVLAYS